MGANVSKISNITVSQASAGGLVLCLFLLRLKSVKGWAQKKMILSALTLRTLLIEFVNSMRKNPLMESMVATGVISYILYTIRSLTRQTWEDLKAMFYCSITVRNTDENYNAVVDYVTKFCSQDKSSLVATTKKAKWNRKTWRDQWNGIGPKKAPEIELRPTRNVVTSFRYKGHRIFLYRTKGETITTGYDRRPLTMESLTLTCFGRDNSILKQLIEAAMQEKLVQNSEEINVFVLSNSWMGGWERALSKKARDKDTVVLDSNISEELLHDTKTFLRSQRWYAERGIPYRRGYLLYGPPGCGKTSFTQVIAGELKQDMCMLSLSDKNLDDSRLAANLREAPVNSIILLEDVDAVFVERSVQKDHQAQVTFSGLLNAIDGVASQEGRMLFMTTNHIEKLDPALIRPGRCDVRVELKKASSMQMKELFLRFFPGDRKNADLFAMKLPKFELSMAQLQGHLLENRTNARLAIDRIPKLLQSTKPQPVDRMSVYDHLRRVGLEQYAAYFEYHGYQYRDQLEGLTSDTVSNWIPSLAYEPLVKRQLQRLLKGDRELYRKQYPLAELSTIREAFIAAFPVKHMTLYGEAPPKLRRLSSYERYGLVKDESDSDKSGDMNGSGLGIIEEDVKVKVLSPKLTVVAKEVEHLSKLLCEKLSRNGKGVVSVWQLHYLFSIFYHPRDAVENAHILTEPRPDDSKRIKPMSSFEFLKRAGLSQAACLFERDGILTARDLLKVNDSDMARYNGPLGPKKKILSALIKNASSDANLSAGMQMLGRKRVVNDFLMAFPGDFESAYKFANIVTDEMGRGLASAIQLEAHLDKYKGKKEAALSNAKKELVDVEKVQIQPPTPKPLPNVWVKVWLESFDFGHLAANFINNHLLHYEDVVTEPVLEDDELNDIGVSKIGQRREIQRRIQALLDGGSDGLENVYRKSKQSDVCFRSASLLEKVIESYDTNCQC
mmetsp:Transcript_20724/g.36868  ORF Transcript_20724/g.36868 Transcript_20724/m.36868 type:complete len:952 (-) Transcript_20724:288-3143(-)|eukprot:CAMPEP_0197532484 /NCGR_PEP_ID=MMETSP1318-20131121/39886_1 /TAXON_ID=552666 /ORGANISM="Partenskyella glossopodia, Strain RCC365" /LENGTH=951 /DNA_ID=CAMNT_0043089055 /DNA_START=108 /DNA_END=2963 /DNA_ORIENTATION=+